MNGLPLRSVLRVAVASVFVIVGVCPAWADTTPINPGGPGEPNLTGVGGILDNLYGWDNLQRVDDTYDEVWKEFNGGATAEAKYAGDRSALWINDFGVGGQGLVKLFDVTGSGYGAGGSGTFGGTPDVGEFNWVFQDVTTGAWWSSIRSQNLPGQYDHMVAWLITDDLTAAELAARPYGIALAKGDYVIAWEDRNLGDADYQDLVVQVYGVKPVPTPSAVISLVGLGIVMGLAGVWRKKR
jgi:hypothetical protein